MGIFKKQKPQPKDTNPPARRRPVSEQNAARPQAFSYYAQRKAPEANTGRGQSVDVPGESKSRSRYQTRPVTVIAVIVGVVALGFVLSLTTNPKVVPVAANGNFFLHTSADYQATAAEGLSSSIFNRNKLTIDTASVSRDLLAHYPELRTANVSIPIIGNQPVVRLEPYQPAFVLVNTTNQAYLIDETGRALALTSQVANIEEVAVPTLEDQSGLSITRGTQALPGGTVQFAREVIQILDAAHVKYRSLTLPAGTSELDVYISNSPYFVKFNLQGDARLQAGTYLATKQRLEKDKAILTQYVDVRVPERAYYK